MRRAGPGADAGSMSLTPAPSSHAVVVGASMGGLAAAAAVSRHVDLVTIVERDELPTSPASRSGTPQGRHLHVLDHALGLRPEVQLCRPLGLASFATESAIRRARWRPLAP